MKEAVLVSSKNFSTLSPQFCCADRRTVTVKLSALFALPAGALLGKKRLNAVAGHDWIELTLKSVAVIDVALASWRTLFASGRNAMARIVNNRRKIFSEEGCYLTIYDSQ